MPRYLQDGRWVKVEDLTLEQLHSRWHKYRDLQTKTWSPKQWARCCAAMNELEQEAITNPKRTKPKP